MLLRLLLLLLLFVPAWSGLAGLPQTIRLAVGENKPPYTFSQPPRGIEYDLLVAVIDRMGCRPEIVMVPNARARALFDEGKIDGTKGVEGEVVSRPYITYQNAAMSLSARALDIKTIDDLRRFRVAAFQDARIFLGVQFGAMAASNKGYVEASPQVVANQLLFGGRADVVISEVHIFDWLNRQASMVDVKQPVTVHHLFAPTKYRIVFHDAELRDAFDKALDAVLAEDPFPALTKKYLPNPIGGDFRP